MTQHATAVPFKEGASTLFPGGLPARGGVGLKPEHFREIIESKPDIGFFEVHAENYMVDGGPFHHYLTRIRADYPLSIHGVGLSIGGETALDRQHLDRLAALIARYRPQSFSEHLAWSSHGDIFLNDLLPAPYNARTLDLVCDHIDQTQEHLRCRILLENPATYVEFAASTMAETDFMAEVLRRTGCGLLLDVNNVYVSCINRGRDPDAWLDACFASIPLSSIAEIHLAGFAQDYDSAGASLLIDSHGSPVARAVWELYRRAIGRTGPLATLLERDNDIPPFQTLLAEVSVAETIMYADAPRELSGEVCA